MGVSDQLRQTSKGGLSYKRQTSSANLKALLEECSSPPHLRVSPSFSKNVQYINEGQTDEKQDREKEDVRRIRRQENNDVRRVIPRSEEDDFRMIVSRENGDIRRIIPKEEDVRRIIPREILSSENSSISETDDVRVVQQITSPEYGKSRKAIREYEKAVENEARKAHQQKQREFEKTMAEIQREAERSLSQLRLQASQNVMSQIQSMEQRQESQAAEIVKQHQTLKQTHEQRKQIHDARIQEAEAAKQRLQEEEMRRKQKENKQRLDMIVKSVSDLQNLNTKLQTLHNNCKYQDKLPEAAKNSLQLVQQLVMAADSVCAECQRTGEATQDKVDRIKKILEQAKNAYEFVKQEIEKVNQAGAKAEAEAAQKAAAAAASASSQPPTTAGAQSAISTPGAQSSGTAVSAASQSSSGMSLSSASATSIAGAAGGASLCVDIEAYKQYTELQNKLQAVEQQTKSLAATPQLKKYKFDIQKAVNTPINAISPVSGDHLRDKLQRLNYLFNGHNVEVGGKRITVRTHADAPAFSKYLAARMFVKKGDEQVSSSHESAFAIAMVAAGLWAEHPDFGELLLAQFHTACPYIVPYYLPKQEGQTDEDYLISRGYRYESGTFEKQDKFLKRMSGIMTLYAAIIVSAPPRGKHPHGIEHAWIWLSRVMNIDPEPDITATMIHDLLQVTGHALCKEYKKQFLKLLHILIKEMLPKLNAVASAGGGGASARLQSLLETSVKNFGTIPVPDGYLQGSFWTS